MQNSNIVIYILVLNLFLAFIYLISRIIKRDYKRGFIMTLFIIFTPMVGVLYLFISWLIYEVYFKKRKSIVSIEELSLRKDKIEIRIKDDIQSALNKVPIEEALIISNTKDTRRLVLDVLKDDTGEYISSIYKAIDNSDSEVSHYAASAITDIIDKFKEKEKILRNSYNNDRKNIEAIKIYRDYLSEFLMEKILSRVEQERYLGLLEDLTINLERDIPSQATGELYYKLVFLFMDIKKMDKAEIWLNRCLDNRKEDLYSYKAGLRFYYINGHRNKFLGLIKDLKQSTIRLDNETLEMIRFYSQ